MTAGVIIGAFEGDNIRMAILLLQQIAEFPQPCRIDPTLNVWARFRFRTTTMMTTGVFISGFEGDNSRTHHQQFP